MNFIPLRFTDIRHENILGSYIEIIKNSQSLLGRRWWRFLIRHLHSASSGSLEVNSESYFEYSSVTNEWYRIDKTISVVIVNLSGMRSEWYVGPYKSESDGILWMDINRPCSYYRIYPPHVTPPESRMGIGTFVDLRREFSPCTSIDLENFKDA